MARIVLQPCKVRADKLVPRKDPPLVLDWKGLCGLFQKDPRKGVFPGIQTLRSIRPSGFLGQLRKPNGATSIFFVWDGKNTTKFLWLTRQYKSFMDSIQTLYRVEEVVWDHSFEELATSSEKGRIAKEAAS